jgi:hypothetical protein
MAVEAMSKVRREYGSRYLVLLVVVRYIVSGDMMHNIDLVHS